MRNALFAIIFISEIILPNWAAAQQAKLDANRILAFPNCLKKSAAEFDDSKSDATAVALAIQYDCDVEIGISAFAMTASPQTRSGAMDEMDKHRFSWALKAVLTERIEKDFKKTLHPTP